MGVIISKYAFFNFPSTYDENKSGLEFVIVNIYESFGITERKIPILYRHLSDDNPTIILFHGNGIDIGDYNIDYEAKISNCNYCIVEYPGYGLHSDKYSSEWGCIEDAKSVLSYLITEKNCQPENIIIRGNSLGTGVACALAHHMCVTMNRPPKGLILLCPLYSAVKTQINIWIPGDIFCNYLLAPNITCPTLIIHGNKDLIVPYWHGVQLANLFPNLIEFVGVEGAGHNNIPYKLINNHIANFISYLNNNIL